MLDICLLGTGGMMPLPYRYLTSMMARYNGASVLIDCGEGTQMAIRKKGWSMNPIELILITHFHGDHISGIGGLLLSMGNAERKEPVTIVGPKGLERVVRSLLVIAPDLPFELHFKELEDDVETFEACGMKITAFRVRHNVICYGYRLDVSRAGRFHPELARENDVPMKFWSRLQKGETIEEDGRVFTPDLVLGEARKGLSVTYCTDTRPVQRIVEMAAGVDLFICEGMYGGHENDAKAREKKHMTFLEAAELAKEAQPKQMWLTHYSPSIAKPDPYLDETRAVFPETHLGRDGKELDLLFEEEEEES